MRNDCFWIKEHWFRVYYFNKCKAGIMICGFRYFRTRIFHNIWLFRSSTSCVTVALPCWQRLGGRWTFHALVPPNVWSRVSSFNLGRHPLPTRPQPFSIRKLTMVVCFWTRALLCFVPNYTALIAEATKFSYLKPTRTLSPFGLTTTALRCNDLSICSSTCILTKRACSDESTLLSISTTFPNPPPMSMLPRM